MSDKTFKEAWAEKEAQGYHYGADALEHVHFGWQIAHEALLADAPEAEGIVNALRALHAGKKSAPSVGGQQLGLEEYRIVISGAHLESLIEAADTLLAQQARIKVLEYGECGEYADDAPGLRASCAEKKKAGKPCLRCPDTYRRDHPKEGT